MKTGTRIIDDRLSPTSRRLVRDIVRGNRDAVQTDEFQIGVREQLAGYGWEAGEISQAMTELNEIANENLV